MRAKLYLAHPDKEYDKDRSDLDIFILTQGPWISYHDTDNDISISHRTSIWQLWIIFSILIVFGTYALGNYTWEHHVPRSGRP